MNSKNRISLFLASMLIGAFLVMILSGCQTAGQVRDTARAGVERAVDAGERIVESEAASLAVKYVVMKYTGGDPERAARVIEVAGAVRERLSGDGESASVDQVEELVREEIDWQSLDEADRFAASEVLRIAFAELREAVGDGLIEPGDRITVTELIDLVESGARLGAGGESQKVEG